MGVESKVRMGEHLFLSVDCSFFRGNEVIFSFLPRHEQEARAFVANIVPYILNTHPGDAAKSFFHPEAVERALNSFWDNDTQEVISVFDKYIEDFEILDDYADEFIPDQMNPNSDTIIHGAPTDGQAMTRVERIITGAETDSIGTLMTNATSQPPATGITPSSILGGSTAGNNVTISSTLSQSGQSVTTTMSQAQVESNILYLNRSVSTIETVVLLMAQNMNLDINHIEAIRSRTQPNEATASEQEDGCAS
jgi:hypothetical protein